MLITLSVGYPSTACGIDGIVIRGFKGQVGALSGCLLHINKIAFSSRKTHRPTVMFQVDIDSSTQDLCFVNTLQVPLIIYASVWDPT